MTQSTRISNQIIKVFTFSDLVNTNFEGENNAICWERNFNYDFGEIVSKLKLIENITEISIDGLNALQLSESGAMAREIIINDFKLLAEFGASPSLNLLKNYDRDDEFDFISTDVYSFHVDRSPIETSTFLCTYFGASSDILSNDNAIQKVLIPEICEKLLKLHDGDEDNFEDFLAENFFDLHYQPIQDAKPINLGTGNLWRLSVDYPGQKVLPCIHRAPVENEGEYRLLLIC